MDIHCPPLVVAIVYYRNDLLEEAMTDTLRWYRVEETDLVHPSTPYHFEHPAVEVYLAADVDKVLAFNVAEADKNAKDVIHLQHALAAKEARILELEEESRQWEKESLCKLIVERDTLHAELARVRQERDNAWHDLGEDHKELVAVREALNKLFDHVRCGLWTKECRELFDKQPELFSTMNKAQSILQPSRGGQHG